MKILGIIPARGGSKGVPGKNIKPLNGKPLLAYTAEVALASEMLETVLLSSDDYQIIEAAKAVGLPVPFVRPSEFAQDDTPTIAVIKHALDWYEKQNVFFDAVCLLQVTSPFRTVNFLNEAILKFTESGCDSLVSVQKVPHEYNPHWTFEADANGQLKIATGEQKIITRRQELPEAYHRDGLIYLTKTTTIQKEDSLYGQKIAFIESPKEFYVNIDTMADWERAEVIAKNNF